LGIIPLNAFLELRKSELFLCQRARESIFKADISHQPVDLLPVPASFHDC